MDQVYSISPPRRSWVYPVAVIALLALFGLAAVAWVYSSFGSLRTARAYAAGQDLITASDVVEVGALLPIEERLFRVGVTNTSGQNYHINGTSDLCRCRVVTPLPVEIPAGETVPLELIIHIPLGTKPGPSECVVVFVTDSPSALLLKQQVRYAVR